MDRVSEVTEKDTEKQEITNMERLEVLSNRKDLLAEVDRVAHIYRLHNTLMDMITESVESGRVQVESIEDIEILLYLDLLLLK